MRRPCTSLLAVFAALVSFTAVAQNYPTKPIRILVPFPPGAFNDTLGRIIAQKFSDGGIGQAFVDNRAGAATRRACWSPGLVWPGLLPVHNRCPPLPQSG